MRNTKILQMINDGLIDELKTMIQEEIYAENLSVVPGARMRYAAMKKYFTYVKNDNPMLQKPCNVWFEEGSRTAFCNSYSIVLTTESCGEMEKFEDSSKYFNVSQMISYDGEPKEVNFTRIIAEAKSKGYSLKKCEVEGGKFRYLLHYDGAYYKIGLLDASFGIIDNGKPCVVYHKAGAVHPMVIKNDIGVCVILPVNYKNNEENFEDVVIVEAEE